MKAFFALFLVALEDVFTGRIAQRAPGADGLGFLRGRGRAASQPCHAGHHEPSCCGAGRPRHRALPRPPLRAAGVHLVTAVGVAGFGDDARVVPAAGQHKGDFSVTQVVRLVDRAPG